MEAEKAGVDKIHVDITDGHFVPNLSMGAPVVRSLRRITRLPLEVHLMISDPDFFFDEFVVAGIDSFLVHWEGNNNLLRTGSKTWASEREWPSILQPQSVC
jgi:ribulose-phosphate 3-epimerase